VRDALTSRQAQIWLTERTVAVTEVQGHSLNVWLLAGHMGDVASLTASAIAWAKEAGFARITINDFRPGWARVLKSMGFELKDDVLVRELGG